MNRREFGIVLGGTGLLHATDPWKEKPSSEWSDTEIQKLRTRSPWAKETSASQASQPTLGNRVPSADSAGSGAPDATPRGLDRGALEGGTQIHALVRWESAQPLIDSAKRPRSTQAESFYILSASGLPVLEQHAAARDNSAIGKEAILENKSVLVRLKERTSIERKGKQALRPEKVEMIEAGNLRVPVFFFSRTVDPIVAEDKEITFHTRYGAMDLKAKFALKDMVYKGKLEL